jgi:hypothetical protein
MDKEIRTTLDLAIKYLNGLRDFENILLSWEVMREPKKESYFSTLYFKGYKTETAALGEATIYVNLRSLTTPDKIIEAIAHEAQNITPVKVESGHYLRLLKEHLASAPNVTQNPQEKPQTAGKGDVPMV